MSSIILEGKVQSTDNAVNLSGVWRFMKDQVSFLNFSYSKVSTQISKELCNTVSFVVPKSNDTENNSDDTLQFIALPSIVHNMIGLYQGDFQITSAEGTQSISEEFFIFAFYSKDSTINLADNDWWIEDYAILPGPPLFAMSAKKLFETNLLGNNNSIMNSQDMLHQCFYGFGKNQFGIFSVLMMLNEKTGSFCLEKKYMLSKYPVGRRAKIPPVSMPTTSLDSTTVTIAKRKRVESSKVRPVVSEYYVSDYNDSVGEVNHYNSHSFPAVNVPEVTSDDDKSYVEGHFDVDSFEVYEGDVFNGIRHGVGICLRPDGTLYEGNWVNGKETGPGKLMFNDRKIIYTGDFLDGLFNGIGIYCFDNGDTYSGEWKESYRKFCLDSNCRC